MVTDRQQLRPYCQTLSCQLFEDLQRLSPLLVVRLLLSLTAYAPWLLYALFTSWQQAQHWQQLQTCQALIARQRLAFTGIDASTLTVEWQSGGVSNINQIWRCRTSSGETVTYFVKVFVAVGSFWAKHLSLFSPFPRIEGETEQERFTVDVASRLQLAESGIPVPRPIAWDVVEKVMVTEYLEGETVDEILQRIAAEQQVGGDEGEAIRQCGSNLAKVHQAGFSLIDSQPINCIWVPGERKVYLTDFEFCTREDKRIWDVGFFLCFLAARLAGNLKNQVRQIFLESYQKERPLNRAAVEQMSQEWSEYLPLMQVILDIRQFTPEELFEELLISY